MEGRYETPRELRLPGCRERNDDELEPMCRHRLSAVSLSLSSWHTNNVCGPIDSEKVCQSNNKNKVYERGGDNPRVRS